MLKNAYKLRSVAAVSERLVLDPSPGSAAVTVVEVAPQIPSSAFAMRPVPQPIRLLRVLVHERHKIPVVELCELCFGSKVAFAECVTGREADDCRALHGKRYFEHAARPTVVVTAVGDVKGREFDGDFVGRTDDAASISDAEHGECAVAGRVSFERVAVVAGEAARPIVFVGGEDCGLQSESLFDGHYVVLQRLRCRPEDQQQSQEYPYARH